MGRPKVFLNCATSHDGRLAAADGSPVRFSDDADLARVHEMRAECDAILVGIETVLNDDPHLTVKPEHAEGDHPLRVVLDTHGRVPPDSRVLDDAAPTLVVTGPDAAPVPGAQQLRVPLDSDGRLDLEAMLFVLDGLGIRSVMVEGGQAVLHAFLESGLWDRLTVFQAAEPLGGDGPRLWDGDGPEALELPLTSKESSGTGTLWTFSPR